MKNEVTVMQTGEDTMDHDTKKTALALLGIPTLFLLVIVAMIPFSLFTAWVAQKLYIWFLLPLHAPHLNLWHVWGITLLVSLFTTSTSNSSNKGKDTAEIIGSLIGHLISPLLLLL